MKTNLQENRTGGSFEIPERWSEGVAGPSRDVPRTGAAAPGTGRAGYENNDIECIEEKKPFNPVRDVVRKTELLGWDVWPANHKRRKIPAEPDEETSNPEEE
jgi:hypothetical protein